MSDWKANVWCYNQYMCEIVIINFVYAQHTRFNEKKRGNDSELVLFILTLNLHKGYKHFR